MDLVGQGLEDGQVRPLGRGHQFFSPGICGRRERDPVERKFRTILLVEDILPSLAGDRNLKKSGLETLVRRKIESE